MKIFIESLLAGLSTIAFAMFYNAPKKTFIASFIAGSVGWFLFKSIEIEIGSKLLGAVFAGFSVGVVGEIASKIAKEPVTAFIIPGILPLVPGAGMYRTMANLVQENYNTSLHYGRESLLIAGSISFGLLLSTVFSKSVRLSKNRLRKSALYGFNETIDINKTKKDD